MGDPIIIWPPGVCDGFWPGCYSDPCAQYFNDPSYYDCSYEYPPPPGMVSCCQM